MNMFPIGLICLINMDIQSSSSSNLMCVAGASDFLDYEVAGLRGTPPMLFARYFVIFLCSAHPLHQCSHSYSKLNDSFIPVIPGQMLTNEP